MSLKDHTISAADRTSAGLSPEEIAALDDFDAGIDPSLDAVEEEEEAAPEVDKLPETPETPAAPDVVIPPTVTEPPPTETAPPAIEKEELFIPTYTTQHPPSVQAKLDALDEKLDETEIDMRQYTKEREALIVESHNLQAATQREEHNWRLDQKSFFRENDRYLKTPVLMDALNSAVIRIANSEAGRTMTGAQALAQAKAEVEAVFGVQPATVKDPGKPKSTIPEVQTLGGLPSAAPEDVTGDEFAALDRMEGAELEATLARMPDAQRQRYLKG